MYETMYVDPLCFVTGGSRLKRWVTSQILNVMHATKRFCRSDDSVVERGRATKKQLSKRPGGSKEIPMIIFSNFLRAFDTVQKTTFPNKLERLSVREMQQFQIVSR